MRTGGPPFFTLSTNLKTPGVLDLEEEAALLLLDLLTTTFSHPQPPTMRGSGMTRSGLLTPLPPVRTA